MPATAVRVNPAHLDTLSEIVSLAGAPALLVSTYCEGPGYRPTGAAGEGLAAVDDVARAGLVYLDHWAATARPASLARARAALNFVLSMQMTGGGFYNFVLDRAGTINRDGATSGLALDWWDCRALWVLARGYAIFRRFDPTFASRLAAAYLRTERLITRHIGAVGTWATLDGGRAPAWLPRDSAALSALAALALAEYQAVAPNPGTTRTLTALGDGLAAFQLGGPGVFPWGLHPHSLAGVGGWHAWGSHEAQALARAGAVLGRRDWVASAQREMDGFFSWQLATERLHELGPLPIIAGQQAYGVNGMVQAAINLYHATGDPHYAQLGGLHASWFLGGNVAGAPVYDSETGRGYDGIDHQGNAYRVSRHAGAESTIEALMALQAVLPVPDAARHLAFRRVSASSWMVMAPPRGEVSAGEAGTVGFSVGEAGEYGLFMARSAASFRKEPVAITLDGTRTWAGAAGANRHEGHRWFQPIAPAPIALAAGPHTLRLDHAGGDQGRTTGVAGFVLHPIVARRTFVAPDGGRLRLSFDLHLGHLSWEE